MNVDFSDPALSDVVIPPDFLTKTYVGRCATDVQPGCSAPGATFTDFNVWSRALTEKEMKEGGKKPVRTVSNLMELPASIGHRWESCRRRLSFYRLVKKTVRRRSPAT